jgi:hypothetical protein
MAIQPFNLKNMSRADAHDKPALCIQEAIDCRSCTASTARELARACPGLPRKLVAQLFVQIHVHLACTRMHDNFAQAYAEAEAKKTGQAVELKKPMGACRPIAATAVA